MLTLILGFEMEYCKRDKEKVCVWGGEEKEI